MIADARDNRALVLEFVDAGIIPNVQGWWDKGTLPSPLISSTGRLEHGSELEESQMLKPRDLKFFAIGAVIVASGLSVFAAVNIPNTFTPNTPIKAEEVNANFSSLKASIEALQAGAGTVADGTLTSSKFADGAIISSKLADASISAAKLITTSPASSGKFLSFDGSNLAWADGAAGTVGPQGPKGDTGATGPQGAPGVNARKIISGYVDANQILGSGFTVTRNSSTRLTVSWSAGTFNGRSVPIVQTFDGAGQMITWGGFGDGSGNFTFEGIIGGTMWFTITAL